MNWDWDKLQEKRQRQPRPPQGNSDRGDKSDKGDTGNTANIPNNNNNSGGGNASGGHGASGGGGDQRPPANLRQFPNDPMRRVREWGMPGGKALWWLGGAAVVLWLLSGIFIVDPDEEGVVLRFGKYDRTVGAGPHYHLPYPIETVYTPKVTQVLRGEVGFRSVGQGATFKQGQGRTIPEESAMLTGDENIVNVQFSVQYKIRDPVEYLFNVTKQAALVHNAAESAMREVIGKSQIDSVLTDGKIKIQGDATDLLQEILNRYEVGVQIIAVQLQDVHPPQEVIDAFKDVASAREDKSRIINEAEAYRNELLPNARGQAAAMENNALAYRATRVQAAEGESQRFLAVLAEYERAKDVTRKRLYYETMEKILSNSRDKILLPKGVGDKMLPFLPLTQQEQKTTPRTGEGR